MTITGARNLITVADPPLQRGGFLDGATVIDVPDGDHSLLGIEYDSYACLGQANPWTGDWCSTDTGTFDCDAGGWTPGVNGEKFGDPTDFVVNGDPFALYRAALCATGLQPMEHTRMQARRSFDFAERRVVDQQLTEWIKARPDLLQLNVTALEPAQALGQLEGMLFGNYGGIPLIAIPMHLLAVFCRDGLIAPNGDGTFHSCAGSTVIGVSMLGTDNIIYGMGRMVLVRGPINQFDAPQQNVACFGGGAPEVPAVPGAPLSLSQPSMLWAASTSGAPGDGHVGSSGGGAVSGVHRWSNLAPGGDDWPEMLLALDPSYTNRRVRYVNPADATQWTEFSPGTPVNQGAYYTVPMTTTGAVGAGGPYAPAGDNSPLTVTMTAVSPGTPAVPATPDYVTGWINVPARSIVERIYVPAIECQPFSVLVNPCPCVSGTVVTTGGVSQPPPTTPPELLYLSHTSVSVGAADFTLHIHGEDLTDDTDVLVNGVAYPTAFIDDHELEIVVHPSDNVPGTVTVRLQNPQGMSATILNFTFTP